MNITKEVAACQEKRLQPLWSLLAKDNAPIAMGLLQSHLYDTEQSLSSTILHERIECDLKELRVNGEDLPETTQVYIDNWVRYGFLERRFPLDADEEVYQLSIAAIQAIRFVTNNVLPHPVVTESRLSLITSSLTKIAEDTDTEQSSRIDLLHKEHNRVDKESEDISRGQLQTLSNEAALERMREIISLANNLISDFYLIRSQLEHLNRDLRMQLINDADNRAEVLEAISSGINLFADSEAGRTFTALWRLLTDPEQGSSLKQALEQILSRDFSKQLSLAELEFLSGLPPRLLEQGSLVQEMLQSLGCNLKSFVNSGEHMKHYRIN